jgi:hypothetical protein
MRFNNFRLLLVFPIALLTIFSPLAMAAAPTKLPAANIDQNLNIEISPLPIQLNTRPGTNISTDLRIRNSGAQAEDLKLSLKTYDAEGPDGHIVLKNPSPNDTFLNWVTFDRSVFTAPPGLWQTIKMNINVPKSAAYGYYFAVQIGLANPPAPKAGSANLQGAVAIFVLLNADSPGAKRTIEVEKFYADHSTYEFLPVKFTVQVRNTGNVHTSPHGNIFIKRGSDQVDALTINSTEGMVLPKSNRQFSAEWKDGFPVYTQKFDDSGQPIKDAKGNIKTELSWNFSNVSKLRFGHYTANLFLVYNDGQRDVPITGSLSFWVIPWRVIFVILIVIAGPAIFVYLLMRRRYGRRLKKAGSRSVHDK